MEEQIIETTAKLKDIFGFNRPSPATVKPNLEILINLENPGSGSIIKVGDTVLNGVTICDIHLDAETDMLLATLKVMVGKLHTE